MIGWHSLVRPQLFWAGVHYQWSTQVAVAVAEALGHLEAGAVLWLVWEAAAAAAAAAPSHLPLEEEEEA